jgi:glycosyltransferase involved in cell wall biosynthesis
MRTILQVVPALNSGGVERTTIEIAQALTQAGRKALVASRGGRMEIELAQAGGELVRMPAHSKNPLQMAANALRLASLARARGVGLIHARSRAPAWSALWAARRLNLPFVTTYHGIYQARTPWKRAYNAVMAKGDIVIANSHYTRGHVIAEHRLDPERVVAIPRGVDLARFDPAQVGNERAAARRREWRIGEDSGLVFLLPARLARWKGQALAVAAAGRVLKERPGALTLVLAGEGRGHPGFRSELLDQAADLGIADRVRLVGHVDDMPGALKAADVALAPSLAPEAFGRAAAEAQAMGVPVIAANHGGLAETIVAGETGLLVEPGDLDALAAAVRTVIDMGAEGRARMGADAMRRARALYSISALQRDTLRVYDRLLGEDAK